MNRICVRFSLLIAMLVLLSPAKAGQPLEIYTVNYPLAYFAERIAGDQVKVVFPAPPGVDPAFWQPDIEIIRAYQQADLILLNGAGYAKWVARTSLPMLRTINTSREFKDQLIKSTSGISHSHGRGESHNHAGTAFTTWLDMSQAVKQAVAIADALKRIRPENRDQFDINLGELEAELLLLDQQIKTLVEQQPLLPMLASHPVYQYLSRRYQLNLNSVLWEPEEVPDAAQLQALKNSLIEHPAKWMIWEAEPNAESVAQLEVLNIKSLVFSPLGNRPEGGDFMSTMQVNLKNLREAFTLKAVDTHGF